MTLWLDQVRVPLKEALGAVVLGRHDSAPVHHRVHLLLLQLYLDLLLHEALLLL